MKKKNKKSLKLKQRRPIVLAVLLLIVSVVAVSYWYFSVSTPDLPEPPLKDSASAHNIDLGIHVLADRLKDEPYADIVKSQYSYITSDAEAHWVSLRPSEKEYDYTEQDKLMAFAKANNMPIQIHHLLWGEANWMPDWLKEGDYTKEQLLDMIRDHIYEVAGHYKGQVAEWTVSNEVFTRAEHKFGLRDWWADHLGGGTDYIDKAFIWAHEADPNAKLIFNDFENEVENSTSNAMYDYIKAAKARGVPIHGIGMQMHLYGVSPPSKEAVIKNMRRFGDIGVKTYVTEFDINVNAVKGGPARQRQVEAQVTYDMVRACIESKTCVSFSGFGVTDKNDTLKWLMGTDSHSFMFDSRYRPKPSFWTFRQAWQKP
jgi:endo-1,4-beta-xylanase